MNVQEQSEIYWKQITSRKRNPVKGATLAAYGSYLKNWILPTLGNVDLEKVENGSLKRLVAKMSDAGLKAATIAGVTNCLKGVLGSAVDDNGNEMYPRKWNTEFIDAPIINAKEQKAPMITADQISLAALKASKTFRIMYVLMGATGLRISEALALKIDQEGESSYWDKDKAAIIVKRALYRGYEQSTKTQAGVREVDIHEDVNRFLLEMVDYKGFMFQGEDGRPVDLQTCYDEAKRCGVPGFHSFRRFRVTHIENEGVPRGLQLFWTGHAGKDVHDRYVKLDRDVQARKDWAAKCAYGFRIPKIGEAFAEPEEKKAPPILESLWYK